MTANFLWVNFSGCRSGDKLWESVFSICHTLYSGETIGESEAQCSCGECKACNVEFEDIQDYYLEMKQITHDGKYIDYFKFSSRFYKLLDDMIKSIYGEDNVQVLTQNIIIHVADKINIEGLIHKFIGILRQDGYDFNIFTSEHSAESYGPIQLIAGTSITYYLNKAKRFPLSISSEQREELLKRLRKC